MKILEGKLIKEGTVINIFKMLFHDDKSFFLALVTLCDRFKIDVPVWTFREDKILNDKGEVTLNLENQSQLNLVIHHDHE